MSERAQHNIEDLLERMGARAIAEDTEHRYALRRTILCSKQFQKSAALHHRKLLLLIVPFFASGFLVMVIMVSSSPSFTPTVKDESTVSSLESLVQAQQVADNVVSPEFLKEGLVAQYIDDRPLVPMNRDSNRVVMHMANAMYSQ